MKAPLSWLKEYVDIDIDIDTLCQKLVNIGLEVEEVTYLAEGIKNVVVGRIEKIEKHPDADRLKVCQVNIGSQMVQIITAAPNVNEGDVVPVALHNSDLPCGKHITKGKLRGLLSEGMMCGGEELGINNDVYPTAEIDGICILNSDEPLGAPIEKVLGLDDYLLDVSITANRPDSGSIYGLAREVAVALGKKCRPIDTTFVVDSDKKTSDIVEVEVLAKDLCPNYYMSVVDEVKIQPSPMWLTRRLHAVGLRGINNMVDITNYVLTELGQPMHAFDYDNITDKTIIVRRANDGETIVPLDGKTYTLNNNVLVIADKTRAVGLAGIMGGSNSGIKEKTSAIAFEAAKFARENIRHNSRSLGLRSDSSARFEKGVDACTTALGLDRALHLVQQLKCGRVLSGRISIDTPAPQKIVTFDFSEIERLLGIEIDKKIVISILQNLNIDTTITDKVVALCQKSVKNERTCDIIEEIIRVYGYDNITSTLLENSTITHGGKTVKSLSVDLLKTHLVGMGYRETVTYSFGGKLLFDKFTVDKEADLAKNIRVLNPLGDELSIMRTQLAPSLLDVTANNMTKNDEEINLFEVSKVYLAKSLPLTELPQEQLNLCMVEVNDDFYSLKDNLLSILDAYGVEYRLERSKNSSLHSGISADIYVGERYLGYVGQLHPIVAKKFDFSRKVHVAEINFDLLYELKNQKIKCQQLPKFPAIDRDFALVMNDEVPVQSIIDTIEQNCPLCVAVNVFDIYKGEQIQTNQKSVALSVKFLDKQRTLKDSDIDPQIAKCLLELKSKFNAVLR